MINWQNDTASKENREHGLFAKRMVPSRNGYRGLSLKELTEGEKQRGLSGLGMDIRVTRKGDNDHDEKMDLD